MGDNEIEAARRRMRSVLGGLEELEEDPRGIMPVCQTPVSVP